MIDDKPKKKERIDFQLENSHYKKLNMYVYALNILVTIIAYLLIINIVSSKYKFILTGIVSFLMGMFIFFNRGKIVKKLSERIHEKNIKRRREENKRGLESTIKRIRPSHKSKRNIKLNIGGKTYFKDKVSNFKEKFKKKDEQSKYIEIK